MAEPLRSEPDRVEVSRGLLQPNSSSDTAILLCLHHMTALEIPEDNSHICLNRSTDSGELPRAQKSPFNPVYESAQQRAQKLHQPWLSQDREEEAKSARKPRNGGAKSLV